MCPHVEFADTYGVCVGHCVQLTGGAVGRGATFQGSSSPMRLTGWSAMRVSTSRR